ncbi:MAG: DUF4112 domain-containing protein [Opitutaceae bacterium]
MASSRAGDGLTRLSEDDALIPPQLKRLRRLAWVLDRSIPIGGYRIGLDPIIGLLPGGGDMIGGMLSLVILYDAARLGLPVRVLFRMLGNILLETIVGAVPLLGDLFDFAWQANARNLRLVEKHYDPQRRERPAGRIGFAVVAIAFAAIVGASVVSVMLLASLWRLVSEAGVQ